MYKSSVFEQLLTNVGSNVLSTLRSVTDGCLLKANCPERMLVAHMVQNTFVALLVSWRFLNCSSLGLIVVVTLPELIGQTNMDHQSVNRLKEELTKLTIWLEKTAPTYFTSEYETPAQEYIDRARSA